MKTLLREWLALFLSLLLIVNLVGSFTVSSSQALVLASVCLTILHFFIKPILKIIILPLNVITLGLIGWFINVFLLYLTTWLVSGFDLAAFSLTLGQTQLHFSVFTSALVTAFIMAWLQRVFVWIFS